MASQVHLQSNMKVKTEGNSIMEYKYLVVKTEYWLRLCRNEHITSPLLNIHYVKGRVIESNPPLCRMLHPIRSIAMQLYSKIGAHIKRMESFILFFILLLFVFRTRVQCLSTKNCLPETSGGGEFYVKLYHFNPSLRD